MNGTGSATGTLTHREQVHSSKVATPPEVLTFDEEKHWRLSWLSTVDHKRIGILYLIAALVFFVFGGLEALFIRLQLAVPNNTLLHPDTYNALMTMHGTTMIFLVAMPALFGLANYFVPLMIGARDMAFPRLNALSFWLIPFGGALLHFSAFVGVPTMGWFAYPPLSHSAYTTALGVDYWILALLVLGIGSVGTAINVIATVLCLRAPGMTMRRLPLFVWINVIASWIVIFALPVLNAGLVMLLFDRQYDTHLFTGTGGGSPVMWQHIFWAFGHPEVYILALPAFAIISEVIPVFSRKPIFGYEFVAISSVGIFFLSFLVWAHHMFTVGMGFAAETFFAIASLLIAVPTGVKVLNWSATMIGGRVQFTTAMLFCIAFIVQFTLGGLSGITHAMPALDWQTHHSYYLIAHFHYVAVGGIVFALLAGIYYWFPKMSGRMLSEKIGKWVFWLFTIGFNATFLIQHVLGFFGMTRRTYTYPDLPHYGWMNMLSSAGAVLMTLASILLVIDIVWALWAGKPAGDNPWKAWTLEWATSSPPPVHNFNELPPIHSRRPLWDDANPDRPDPIVGSDDISTPDKSKTCAWIFILSEVAFFGTLILSFLFYNAKPQPGPNSENSLDLVKTGIFSVFLFASSFTLWRSEVAEQKKNHGGMLLWLGITILFGIIFMGGQALEYYELYKSGVYLNTNHFSTTFYLLTGFHGFHVTLGIIALSIVWVLALLGDFKKGKSSLLVSIGLYWHFVDIVWVFVLAVAYLIPRFLFL